MNDYLPLTYRDDDAFRRRLSFLPSFPSSTLLLSNVPTSQLSNRQLICRQSSVFPLPFKLIERRERSVAAIPSFMKFLHRNLMLEWSEQWKIDASIIDHNLTRLDEITVELLRHDDRYGYRSFHLHEWPLALEIFLQIDGQTIVDRIFTSSSPFLLTLVDRLFMKTCTYRHARRRRPIEGLFCLDPPDVRYYMVQCMNTNCFCCYQPLVNTHRTEPSVRFVVEQPHRLVNGYEIYLNAHAVRLLAIMFVDFQRFFLDLFEQFLHLRSHVSVWTLRLRWLQPSVR